MVYTVIFSVVWSGSTQFAILSSLIRVYTVCHSWQSDQLLQCLSFSAVWSGSRLFAILSKQLYRNLNCMPFSVWSVSTLFSILSSLFRVYTIFHSQLSVQGLYCLPFSAVWSRSTLFAFLSSLIRVYTICHSQQSDKGLHYLPFSAVWSRSRSALSFSGTFWSRCTLFTILSSLVKVYTICRSQQSVQGLHCLPFSTVRSKSALFAILNNLIF